MRACPKGRWPLVTPHCDLSDDNTTPSNICSLNRVNGNTPTTPPPPPHLTLARHCRLNQRLQLAVHGLLMLLPELLLELGHGSSGQFCTKTRSNIN